MKFGALKVEKSQSLVFEKKNLIWRYSQKRLRISPKSDTLLFFSKTALMIFFVFGLKLVLNMTFNLNETYFPEEFAICRYLTSNLSKFQSSDTEECDRARTLCRTPQLPHGA